MAKILTILTRSSTLTLCDGTEHPSGYWAEELVVPVERFVAAGHTVDIATVGGVVPTVDEASLSPQVVGWTRPAGSPDRDEEQVKLCRVAIDRMAGLQAPLAVGDVLRDGLAGYSGVYIGGGHGAMDDMPRDVELTLLLRRVLYDEMPLAVVCHGHSALLPLRDPDGQWPLRGFRMTAFSREEELATALAGQLPFVLQVELERLGALYESASRIWGSHVVTDRFLLTGQNPHSSADLAEAFVRHIAARTGQTRPGDEVVTR